MTVHDVTTGHEAAADFSVLLAEAARVLRDMASDPDSRAEDHATLQEIHSEGAEFASLPGIPSALRGIFASVLALGNQIAAVPGQLPDAMVAQVHVIESLARSIAAGLDETGDDTAHVRAIVRNIAALTSASPTATDLRGATDAARAALEQFVGTWAR